MILIYADDFPLGTVFKYKSYYMHNDVITMRSAESILADTLRPLYRNVVIYSDSRYEANMWTRYVVVDQPLTKVDVNSMYPTALLKLYKAGKAMVDPQYISIINRIIQWRQWHRDGYVVALNVTHSDYAVFKKDECRRRCTSKDVVDLMDKRPTDFTTAAKTLIDLPCCGVVMKAKDLAKYMLLIAVGRIKTYDTASWHMLISYAHELFLRAIYSFKQHENDDIAGIYVDTAFLFSRKKAETFQKYLRDVGYDSKIDAVDNRATMLLAVNYYIDDVAGAWLLGIDDKGYQDGIESDCGQYPRTCSLLVNMYERFNSAGKMWCKYISRHLQFVKCVEYSEYVEIYITKEGYYRVDIKWSENDVLNAIRALKSEVHNYFYGFL